MNFKFFNNDNQYGFYQLEPTQLLTISRPLTFNNDVEFCFQFDDEEPVSFATGPNECTIRLSPSPDGNMTFNNNGRVFKLFARERQNG